MSRRETPTNNFATDCCRKFQRRYLDSLAVLKNVRRQIGSAPSVFWYFPAETIFNIMAQYSAGPGTTEAEDLYNRLTGRLVTTGYRSSRFRAERFVNSDPNFNTMLIQRHVYEHACRSYPITEAYTSGIKPTQSNRYFPTANEMPTNFYLRSSARTNAEVYRESMMSISGYNWVYGPGERGNKAHPMCDLAAWSFAAYGRYLKESYVDEPLQIISALSVEIDAAIHLAHTTEPPATEADRAVDIYGHSTDNNYNVKPWNVIQHQATFYSQNLRIGTAITGGPHANISPDNLVEVFECFKFHTLVQDFQDLFRHYNDNARSILSDRLRVALTADTNE